MMWAIRRWLRHFLWFDHLYLVHDTHAFIVDTVLGKAHPRTSLFSILQSWQPDNSDMPDPWLRLCLDLLTKFIFADENVIGRVIDGVPGTVGEFTLFVKYKTVNTWELHIEENNRPALRFWLSMDDIGYVLLLRVYARSLAEGDSLQTYLKLLT